MKDYIYVIIYVFIYIYICTYVNAYIYILGIVLGAYEGLSGVPKLWQETLDEGKNIIKLLDVLPLSKKVPSQEL
jgi:hypothetical protein